MKFARRVHSNTTLKGGEEKMEIEYLKKQLNYVQVSQLFLSKIVGYWDTKVYQSNFLYSVVE